MATVFLRTEYVPEITSFRQFEVGHVHEINKKQGVSWESARTKNLLRRKVDIGAVLTLMQDGEERVIEYYSKNLNIPERNYYVS